MSRATELAKAEAEAVEAVEAQDEADADLEAAVANEDADRAEDDGASMEATLKKLDAEHGRHEAELRSVFGADFDMMTDCPVCDTLGYRALEAPVVDPDLVVCPKCKGWGFTVTPSQRDDKKAQPCAMCGENGFITKPFESPAPAPVATAPMFDPYTGQPVASYAGGAVTPPSPNGEWAPGYTPPPQPLPPRS